ncbi:MAG: DUF1552 domain-containing protein [Kofleriaceae bacterium]|nr:DUF1552 domain-containing protein [Kofleriaceae bacterium]
MRPGTCTRAGRPARAGVQRAHRPRRERVLALPAAAPPPPQQAHRRRRAVAGHRDRRSSRRRPRRVGWVSSLTGGRSRPRDDRGHQEQRRPAIGRPAHRPRPARAGSDAHRHGQPRDRHLRVQLPRRPVRRAPARAAGAAGAPRSQQPRALFNRLFPNGDGSTPPDPRMVAQPDVLASVAGMYDAMASRLSTEDRRKLETHRDLLSDMEARLRRLGGLTQARAHQRSTTTGGTSRTPSATTSTAPASGR